MYNEEHEKRLAKESKLPNSEGKVWEEIKVGETEINISGKVCKVVISRNKEGNIEIEPTEDGIWNKDGWLSEGHCVEGYNFEVILSQHNN